MAQFTAFADTCVVGEDRKPVEPGSGVIGRLALTGHIPLGYHNDPEKTAETFVEVDGRRHVITGDMATVEADGSIQLLGRGSQCINTGGEKVFPEEVEAVLHGHPAVADVLVVGVPDERWGSVVTAVVAPVPRRDPRARGAARALPRHPGRLQAARSTSWSSTASGAHRPARPTTPGPSRPPRPKSARAGSGDSARRTAARSAIWRDGGEAAPASTRSR